MTSQLTSILVPCFNQGATLPETIASVEAQTRPDWELLIVDDGSTDPATRSLFETLSTPRARVFRTENQGLAASRNLLANHARGDYLCALDSDDLLQPTFLEKTVEILENAPDLTFASCWLETFDEESWLWKPQRCDLPAVLAECTIATPALVRREAVLGVGGWDESMPHPGYEDWDLWISLLASGAQGVIHPEVLFRYRRRSDSMSSICCHGEVHLELMDYLFEKHEASYREHLDEVLGLRDGEIGDLLRDNWELEKRIYSWLEPESQRRREENQRLQSRLEVAKSLQREREKLESLRLQDSREAGSLAELEERILELDAERNRHLERIQALEASLSWQCTAPLRRIWDLVKG